MAAANNPLEGLNASSQTVSKQSHHIGGIRVHVHGVEELPSNSTSVAILWLLHPRLQTHESMIPVAAAAIHSWNARLKSGNHGRSGAGKGLLAVSFDQRNHGERMVDALGNEGWRQGNERHAQDMFSIYAGTAQDTSLLIDYIGAYVFPANEKKVDQHLALGISLGGHSVWHCLMHDERITAGVVVIGCPDYVRLMSDRARLSKLATFAETSPPGRDFLGSRDFPKPLVEAIEKYDPAGLLLGELDTVTGSDHLDEPSEAEKKRLRPILRDSLGGKRIMCLSGGADKLVPYKQSEPFLTWLKHALRKDGGWFNDRGTVLEDIVDKEAGHVYSEKMKVEAMRFVCETLAGDGPTIATSRTSKI